MSGWCSLMACSSSKAFCSIRSCMILLPSAHPPPGPLSALLRLHPETPLYVFGARPLWAILAPLPGSHADFEPDLAVGGSGERGNRSSSNFAHTLTSVITRSVLLIVGSEGQDLGEGRGEARDR